MVAAAQTSYHVYCTYFKLDETFSLKPIKLFLIKVIYGPDVLFRNRIFIIFSLHISLGVPCNFNWVEIVYHYSANNIYIYISRIKSSVWPSSVL